MIGIALRPDLHGETLVRRVVGVLGLEVGGDLHHLLERRRRLGDEIGVAEQGDVLHGVGQAVRLPLVGERFDRHVLEAVGDARQVERLDDAVGHRLADSVVSGDDDVGPLALRPGHRQQLADVAERQFLDLDDDAVLLGERLGDLLDDRCSGVAGPDHEVGVAALGRGRGRFGAPAGAVGAGWFRAGRLGAGRDGGGAGGAGGAEHGHGREQ